MTIHIDKVTPFVGEVPKNWLAAERSSDVRKLPERADEETLVNAPNTEPASEQVSAKSADNELIDEPEPEDESALSTNIDYEVNSTQPTERARRKVRTLRRICTSNFNQRAKERLERSTVYYCNEQ